MTDVTFFVLFSSLKHEWYLMGIIIICYIFLFVISKVWYLVDFFFFFRLGTGTWAFISDLPERSTNLLDFFNSRNDIWGWFFCSHMSPFRLFTHTCTHATTHTLMCVRATTTQCVCDTQLYSIGLLCRGDKVRLFTLFILTNQSYYISGTLKWFAVKKWLI